MRTIELTLVVVAATAVVATPATAAVRAKRARTGAAHMATANGRTLAGTVLRDGLRIGLHAQRVGAGRADVYMTFTRPGRQWAARVPGRWSWAPLANRGAVCRFGVSDRPGRRPAVLVSLRSAAATRCSRPLKYTILG